MEIFRILFGCPKCWQAAGAVMFSVAFFCAVIGWRLAGRAERAHRRTSVDLDHIFASVPLPIPTTGEDFAFAIAAMVTGVCLAMLGKWAQRQMPG